MLGLCGHVMSRRPFRALCICALNAFFAFHAFCTFKRSHVSCACAFLAFAHLLRLRISYVCVCNPLGFPCPLCFPCALPV